MKGVFVFTTIALMSFSAFSQKGYMPKGGKYGGKKTKYRTFSGNLKRNATDIFPLDPEYNLNGWFASIGGTYMFPMSPGEGNRSSSNSDSIYSYTWNSKYTGKPKGSLGLYADIGWFHSFQNPGWFHFYEVGISYRQYRGREEFSGSYTSITDSSGNTTSQYAMGDEEYLYNDRAVSAVVKFTNHRHFSRYGFVQNSIGVNFDYFFSKSRSAIVSFPGYEADFHPDLLAQFSYRLGVGWKATPLLLVVPSLELPLVTIFPFDSGKSSLLNFSSRHYPIIFTIRFMLLRRLSEDCRVPPYDGPRGFEN